MDARARPRDPAEPLAESLRRARRGPRAHRHGGEATGAADARHARLRRDQPPELMRAGRVADRLPPARARDPALRERPAPPPRRAARARGGRAGGSGRPAAWLADT